MKNMVEFIVAMIFVTAAFGLMAAMTTVKRRLYIVKTPHTIVWIDPRGITLIRK